jgi:KDO2-lipid IV(A) lauroyltransferase
VGQDDRGGKTIAKKKVSFTKLKDRIGGVLFGISRGLGAAPRPIQWLGYGAAAGFVRALYFVPGLPMRKTARAYVRATGGGSAWRVYTGFADGVIRMARRMEQLRQGGGGAIDALFRHADPGAFERLVAEHGRALIVMPHCHGALMMVRGFAARYPTFMLIREPSNDDRAARQRPYFEDMGCEILDVRRNNEAAVARAVLKALKQGKFVIGTVDRIKHPPPVSEPIDKLADNVRIEAFGEAVGVAGWPVRFADKCGVPILPVMVEHTDRAVTLHAGAPIIPGDVLETTQAWADALELFYRRFPRDWINMYDKHWTRVLKARGDKEDT